MKKILLMVAGVVLAAPFFVSAQMAQTAQTQTLSDQFTQDTQQSDCIDLRYNLSYRSRDARTNNEVSLLQDFLITQGYLSGESTGYFGAGTRVAVRKFQSATLGATNATPGYGGIGPKSRAKIKAMTCGDTATTTTQSSQTTTTRLEMPIGCSSAINPATGSYCSNTTSTSLPAGCTSTIGFSTTTGVRCSAVSATTQDINAALGTARLKATDATIKASLANLRPQAELYYDAHSQSYNGFCTDSSGYSSAGKIKEYLVSTIKAAEVICNDSAKQWAMSARLKSADAGYWCVDSTGASKQTTRTIAVGEFACSGSNTTTLTQSVISSNTNIVASNETIRPGLVYPTGGEVWQAGQTYTLKWAGRVQQIVLMPANADGTEEKMTYRPDSDIIAYDGSSLGNASGAISWTVPAYIDPGYYLLHVANSYGGFDSKVFTIEQKKELNITSPGANDTNIEMGKTYIFRWTGPLQKIVMKPIDSSGNSDSSRQEVVVTPQSSTPTYDASVSYAVKSPATQGRYLMVATSDTPKAESKVTISVVAPVVVATSAPVIASITPSIDQNGTITIAGSNFSATENYVQIDNRQFGPVVSQNGALVTLNPSSVSPTLLTPGTHTVNVIRNPGYWTSNSVSLVVTATVTQPAGDLIVQDLTWTPNSPGVSSVDPYIYFTLTIKNNGTGSVVLPTGTKFALTKNGVSYGGVEIGTPQILAQGEIRTIAFTTTQSPNLRAEAGTFTIVLTADSTNLVPEINEGNNTISKTITITP